MWVQSANTIKGATKGVDNVKKIIIEILKNHKGSTLICVFNLFGSRLH